MFHYLLSKKSLALGAILICLICPGFVTPVAADNESGDGFDHSHTRWAQVLSEYLVTDGHKSSVRYAALKEQPEPLRRYLQRLSDVSKAEFDDFSKNQQLAFLINAYNAFTLELIIQHYPVESIKDIGGWFSSPWEQEFFTLLGKKRTLDTVEHDMIRVWYNEPRIHFALVCAARSCPPLRREPFVAEKIDKQLTEAATNFLSDPDRNYLKGNTLYVSSIFKWYGDDFNSKYGSARNYVARFFDVDPAAVSMSFLPYDWSLNDARD